MMLGVKNPQHQFEIAENLFTKGVSIAFLREVPESDQIAETIGKSFRSDILIHLDGVKEKQELLHRLAEWKLFSIERKYLFVGSSLEDFHRLIQPVAVFENAQIRFVQVNSTAISVYFVTNPAQPFGGRFNYHLDSVYWITDQGLVKDSNINNPRPDLDWTTVTLPVGIVSLKCENTSTVSDEFMQWYEAEVDASQDASPRLGHALFTAFQKVFGFKSVSNNLYQSLLDLIQFLI